MERGRGWTEAREDMARPEVTWQVVPSEVRLGRGATRGKGRGEGASRGPGVAHSLLALQGLWAAGVAGGGQSGFSARTLGATAESGAGRGVLEGWAHQEGRAGRAAWRRKRGSGRNLPTGPRRKPLVQSSWPRFHHWPRDQTEGLGGQAARVGVSRPAPTAPLLVGAGPAEPVPSACLAPLAWPRRPRGDLGPGQASSHRGALGLRSVPPYRRGNRGWGAALGH